MTAGGIVERDGKILVVRDRFRDRIVLTQPSGHVEKDEFVLEALVREVREETGYTVEPVELIGIYHQQFSDNGSVYNP